MSWKSFILIIIWFPLFSEIIFLEANEIKDHQLSSVIDEEKIKIAELSLLISSFDKPDSFECLKLYAERGNRFFLIGFFENALDDFNHILKTLLLKKESNNFLFASAIWGRLLSHAYSDCVKETIKDLNILLPIQTVDVIKPIIL